MAAIAGSKQAQADGNTVKGVRIAGTWEEVDIDVSDPIWTEGTSCPIPKKLGVPLIVRRDPGLLGTGPAGQDNQPVTYLMIHPRTGLAPPEWQLNPGPAIVARKDKKPLLLNQLDIIYEYMCDLIDEVEDIGMVPPERMSKAALKEHWDEMVEERKMSQQMDDEDEEEKEGMASPTSVVDWDAVPRPF